MCYAIPGKLIKIQDNIGIIDYYGEKKKALIGLVNVREGDYVYAQGGILINKIPEREALETLETWEELFFELKEKDKTLANKKIKAELKSTRFLQVLEEANRGKALNGDKLKLILETQGKEELALFFNTANNMREREHGNSSCVHGIIEFSNHCKENCFYCGIRNERYIERYRMSEEEIVDRASYAVKELGFKALVLQSGEDYWYTDEKLARVISRISQMGVLIFLSIGERSKETYELLYAKGARAALLRFETSNKDTFEKLRPSRTLEDRLSLIRYLKKLGYVVATGFLAGLPGETIEDVINNILLTKRLGPDMYSFGAFIPVSHTPLENYALMPKDDILRIIALARIMDKKSNILVSTSFEVVDKSIRREGLLAGANSLMINLTPRAYRALYEIYDRRNSFFYEIKDEIKDVTDLLFSLGRAPIDL